jgi:DNA-binding response OmpR family regulator
MNVNSVLVVDDDPNLSAMLEAILTQDRYAVVKASDGVEAQEVLKDGNKEISAIILDWAMPRLTGIEFLKWVKDEGEFKEIPVIMHTALTEPDRLKEAIDAGAYYYLPKPASPQVIHSIVHAAVSDFEGRRNLLKKLSESENPFRLLQEGTFKFRTIKEGEYLAVRIANTCPEPERASMVVEVFINAIEHGNLGISYQDKGRYMEQGTWYQEIERRLDLPENKSKYVHALVQRHPEKLTVVVQDQGPGFDFSKYLNLDSSRLLDNHGRGIAMARAFLDLQYMGNGNKVLVTVPFSQS